MRGIFTSITDWFSKSTKPKLEYIMIFQKSGVPIYSKCFGDFCYLLTADESLFSGFLAALTTMPEMLSENKHTLQSVEMSHTKLVFDYTTPSGNVIVLGFDPSEINAKSKEIINKMFLIISRLIEEDFGQYNWYSMDDEKFYKFEHEILERGIDPFVKYEADSQQHLQNCPLCIAPEHDMKIDYRSTLWEKLSSVYKKLYVFVKTDKGKEVKMKTDKVVAKWNQKPTATMKNKITRIKDI